MTPAPPCAAKNACASRQSHRASAARQQRHAALLRQRAGARLVAEQRQLVGRGADEGEPGVGAGLREVRPLAEEAVAGMHRVAAGGLRDADQRGDVEIGRRTGGVERHATRRRCARMAWASPAACTATLCSPRSATARPMRSAISPRLATRILLNIGRVCGAVDRGRQV